jgi:hypothetical protein
LTLSALACLTLASCIFSPSTRDGINNIFDIPPPPYSGQPVTPPEGCYSQSFQQPEAQVTRKIDILFITDSSGSFNEERGAVADGIDSFVAALPPEVDYTVAVMLAHGSTSSYTGKLFQSSHLEPYVLASSSLTLAEIRTKLHDKLNNPPSDHDSDGGEEGLYALNRLFDDDRMALAQSQGFFRNDAAFVPIFLADENDICAVYPEGVTPVPDGDHLEIPAHARDCTRTIPAVMENGVVISPAYTETISPELVAQKITAHQMGRPWNISGVVYNNLDTVPVGGENEYGYGYMDAITVGHGLSVDMASGDYAPGLSDIGHLATVQLNLVTDVILERTGVLVSSIHVYVDGVEKSFVWHPETNTVHLNDPGHALSTIEITYCLAPPGVFEGCTQGSFTPKSSLTVGLATDTSDADSTNALVNAFHNGLGVDVTVYDDNQVIAGQPVTDGKTVMVLSRKVIGGAASAGFVNAMVSYMTGGGSVLAEFDGAALLFNEFSGVISPFTDHFATFMGLFSGSIAGGGALFPIVPASSMNVSDPADPIMANVPSTLSTGLRQAFVVTGMNESWLHVSGQFTSSQMNGLAPPGTYPAVLSGRCASNRVSVFTMTHLSALETNPDVQTMTRNALYWLIGQTPP